MARLNPLPLDTLFQEQQAAFGPAQLGKLMVRIGLANFVNRLNHVLCIDLGNGVVPLPPGGVE